MHTHNSPKACKGNTLRSLSMALASSAVLMGFIGVSMPAPAAATAQATPRQEIVRYRDLDLTKAADAERLKTRIRRAAKRVCSQPGSVGIWLRVKQERCATQATDNAWADATSAISHKRRNARTARN